MPYLNKRQRIARNQVDQARVERIRAEKAAIVAIVQGGKCPLCGRGLKRNLSMTGWWQCEQLGSEAFRKYPDLPSCSWQGFTE